MTLRWTHLAGLLALGRWREHLPYVIPMTLFGTLLADRFGAPVDERAVLVLLANALVTAFAFALNEIEDAPDDAANDAKANPVSDGRVPARVGLAVYGVLALVGAGFYLLVGQGALVPGLLTLLLGTLYSWRGVRLKAWPGVDIASHALMLGGLWVLSGAYAAEALLRPVWLMAASAALLSAYGQLYNQLRDYDADKAAGLRNTTLLLGKRTTRGLMIAFALGGFALIGTAIGLGAFPLWLAPIAVVTAALLVLLARPQADARGSQAVELGGRAQTGVLLWANVLVLAWLVQVTLVGGLAG